MKKIITLVLAVALVFGIVSCASSASANQETINKAFAAAYEKYRNSLVLDNAGVHEVKPGDTLTQIAKDRYGSDNGYYFPLIMLASSDVVLDPDLIQPGMKLTIPDLQRNKNDYLAAKNMKQYFYEIADVYKYKKTAEAKKTRQEIIKLANAL